MEIREVYLVVPCHPKRDKDGGHVFYDTPGSAERFCRLMLGIFNESYRVVPATLTIKEE